MIGALHVAEAAAVLAAAAWCMTRLLGRGGSGVLVGCALAPLAIGIPCGLVRLLGWPADAGAAASALAIAGALVATRYTHHAAAHAAGTRRESSLRGALPVALGAAVIVACAYLVNPLLAIHSDAWFHAAVTARVHDVGVPPLDPYYAGLRLLYFWFFHVYLDAVSTLSGLSPFGVMALSNVAAVALFVWSVADLTRALGGGHRSVRAAALLSVLGVNPFGWMFLVARALAGENRGLQEITQALMGGAGVLSGLGWHYTGSLAFWSDKFLVGTALSLALVPMVLVAGVAVRAVRGALPPRRAAIECGLLLMVLTMLHSVLALGTAVALVSTLSVAAITTPSARRAALAACGGAAAGVALTSSYLYFLLAGKERTPWETPRVDWENLWTAAAAGVLLWVCLAVGCVLRARSRTAPAAGDAVAWRAALAWPAGALIPAAVCPLPGPNENKFLYPVLAVAAALAAPGAARMAGALRRRVGRPAAVVLLACVLVPTSGLALTAFVLDAGAFAPASLDPTEGEREAYAWIAAHTPRSTIVLDAGGRRDVLVYARRDVLWGGAAYADQWGYPREAIARRRQALDHAFAGGLLPADRAFLRSLERPVIALSRRAGPRAAGDDLAEVYRNADIVIDAVTGTVRGDVRQGGR